MAAQSEKEELWYFPPPASADCTSVKIGEDTTWVGGTTPLPHQPTSHFSVTV